MNHQIDTYAFNGSTVRIHTSGEQVEYCARDIATALATPIPTMPSDAIARGS